MAPDQVMRRWPATIRVFLDYGMACIGCPVARIHTLEDACMAHGIPLEGFLAKLAGVIRPRVKSAPRPAKTGGAGRGP
jgi:hybrid cluster-associated redox disulfide protein